MITFNHEKYIAQAIESVMMQQTNFDFELVIGEDCSIDKTREIVTGFAKKCPDKIKILLHPQNLGLQGRNNFVTTFKACQGQYIALLEGDDYWTSPHKLQKQVDFLDNNPEYAICFHNAIVFYEDQSQKPWNYNPVNQKEISTLEDLLPFNFIATCSAMVRKTTIGELPTWYTTIEWGDLTIFILAAQHGKIGYINEVMGAYRKHSGGEWHGLSRIEQLEKYISFYEKINCYLNFLYEQTIKASISKYSYELAMEYEKHGDLDKATTYLNKSLVTDPTFLLDLINSNATKNKIEDRLRKTEEQLKATEEQVILLNEQLTTKEEYINQLLNSRSWKITAPLRKIHGFFQKKKSDISH